VTGMEGPQDLNGEKEQLALDSAVETLGLQPEEAVEGAEPHFSVKEPPSISALDLGMMLVGATCSLLKLGDLPRV